MYLVFVKHYLNKEGMTHFAKAWFPSVNKAISKQPGFVEINSKFDATNPECIHIKLRFQTQSDLMTWAKTPLHDDLVDKLDSYRTRSWEWASYETQKDDEDMDKIKLDWNEAIPRTIAYNCVRVGSSY